MIAGLVGILFGFMLSWARFVDYDVIVRARGPSRAAHRSSGTPRDPVAGISW